jgi:dephospho-CoA kinase
MLKVGLTGNIGSGKSVVARMFETLGVHVYDADAKAHNIIAKEEVIKHVLEAWGGGVLDKNGKIDRKKLAGKVFAQEKELERLDKIVHPLLLNDYEQWLADNSAQPYVLMESAILFDTGFDKIFDKMIVVSAPEDLRLARVMKRENIPDWAVRVRMQHQKPESEIIPLSHFVIVNDGEQLVIPQVLKIHEELGVMSREL